MTNAFAYITGDTKKAMSEEETESFLSTCTLFKKDEGSEKQLITEKNITSTFRNNLERNSVRYGIYEKDGKYYRRGSIVLEDTSSRSPLVSSSAVGLYYYAQEDYSLAQNKWVYLYDIQVFKGSTQNKLVWRYYGSDFKYVKGDQTINGVKYYFSENGYLQIGWFDTLEDRKAGSQLATSDHNHGRFLASKCHYSYPDGSIREGWVQDNGKWYYIYSDGAMAQETTTPDGYYVNTKGVCVS